MRGRKASDGAAAPIASRSHVRLVRLLLLGALSLALAACGSVQTTSFGSSSDPQSVSDSRPPVIAGIPPTTAQVGVLYDYVPVVSDAPSAALTFSITNKPAWATFNTATGELAGSPGDGDVGVTNEIEISVADGVGSASVGPFRITVAAAQTTTPPSEPPTISGTPATNIVAGQPYQFTPSASDPNGNALTFVIVNRPAWLTFSTATGQLSGTPPAASVGSYANIILSVSNGTLNASLPAFTITVSPAPSAAPPTIRGTPQTSVVAGSAYDFTPTANDPAGNPLSFSIQNQPAWASFNSGTGELSGSPSAASIGSFTNIVISVSDGTGSAALPAFSINVTAAATGAPTISGAPPTSIVQGSTYSFTPTATDPAGNPLTFSIQNLPNWANFTASTGELSGIPATSSVGSYPGIVISVSDGTLSSSLPPFTITVTGSGAAPPPTITGTPPTSVVQGSAYSFTPTASDPAGTALTFSIQNRPSWANFDTGSGQLSGTPTAANLGSYPNIVISVSDGTLSASLPAFKITVSAATDGPPTIGGNPPISVNVGAAYDFTPSAHDPQGQALTFSIQNQPTWASFNTTTGELSGAPAAANVGTYPNITISVSNGASAASLPAFDITVTEVASGSLTVNWSAPSQNTNGTALTNLAGYYIYYGTNANALTQSLQISNPGITTYTINNLAPGTWYVGILDYTSAGVRSTFSNIASGTIQ